jgi:hypothetical protein
MYSDFNFISVFLFNIKKVNFSKNKSKNTPKKGKDVLSLKYQITHLKFIVMKIMVNIVCDINKVTIESAKTESFKMIYDDMLGLDLFFSILLQNVDMMSKVSKQKLDRQFAYHYGKEIYFAIADGSNMKTTSFVLPNTEADFRNNMNKLKQIISVKEGKLSL